MPKQFNESGFPNTPKRIHQPAHFDLNQWKQKKSDDNNIVAKEAAAAAAAADNPKLLSSLQIQFQLNPLHRTVLLHNCTCIDVVWIFALAPFLSIFRFFFVHFRERRDKQRECDSLWLLQFSLSTHFRSRRSKICSW